MELSAAHNPKGGPVCACHLSRGAYSHPFCLECQTFFPTLCCSLFGVSAEPPFKALYQDIGNSASCFNLAGKLQLGKLDLRCSLWDAERSSEARTAMAVQTQAKRTRAQTSGASAGAGAA
eukprot:4308466-Amphidinium_carterae.1